MRRRGGLVIGVLVGVLALAAAGCGGGDDEGGGSASATTAAPETTSAPETTAATGGEDEFKLTASDFKWEPNSLDLQAGSEVSVEVSNQGQTVHSFTFADADADQDIPAGEDATITFTAPDAGTYQFICKYHPNAMTGSVTVT
jgi:plastocyanin